MKHYKLNKRGRIQLIIFIFILFVLGMYKVYQSIPSIGATIEVYANDTELDYVELEEVYSATACEEVIAIEFEPEVEAEPIRPYDDETVEVLTNLLYGEARGIPSDAEKAAVIWCVLNRYDNGNYGNTIIAVATAKHQFCGYVKGRTYADMDSYNHCKEIVIDVLDRYYSEGQEGRTLPNDYLYFVAKNGHNVFTKTWKSTNYWDWSLPNPYI